MSDPSDLVTIQVSRADVEAVVDWMREHANGLPPHLAAARVADALPPPAPAWPQALIDKLCDYHGYDDPDAVGHLKGLWAAGIHMELRDG